MLTKGHHPGAEIMSPDRCSRRRGWPVSTAPFAYIRLHNAFAAEYRTKTRGLLLEIEDLKLSNKKRAQALQEVGGKVDKYASARSNGPATDLREENADRTKQHTKERRELSSAKSTRSIVGDRRAYEVNPDLPQRPHRQPLGMRSSQPRRLSASRKRRGSRLRHDGNNHLMEKTNE